MGKRLTAEEKEAKKKARADAKAEKDAAKLAGATPETPVADYKALESPGLFVEKPESLKARQMVQALLVQERIKVLLPLNLEDKLGNSYDFGCINGLKFHVLKGITVTVPRQIGEHLTEAYTASAQALKEVTVVNPITGRPVKMNLDEKSDKDRERLKL